jgi:two-component system response regulator FixJ
VLVDDDLAVRESLAFLLECHGFDVRPFGHPRDFLAADLPPRPCCVLLDLRLPSLSGIEVLGRLRARGEAVPVLLITGHGDAKAAADARALGAFDFLEKPFDDLLLVSRIREALTV